MILLGKESRGEERRVGYGSAEERRVGYSSAEERRGE
jgi:hypothetical protein